MLGDRDKRDLAAQILGQAYVSAHNLMLHNRKAVEKIAGELVVRRVRQTLIRSTPPALGQIDTLELGNIDRLTRPRVFEN